MKNFEKEEITLADGSPVTPGYTEINPLTGQQQGYMVLSEKERSKGFVRPYRASYTHVGARPPANLRDLTPEEKERYAAFNYVKFEEYPPGDTPVTGKYWTADQLANMGCGKTTMMGRIIAETYARKPSFYGSTFCIWCKKHLPVEEFVWEGTDERVGS